jgi:hypothetical protein
LDKFLQAVEDRRPILKEDRRSVVSAVRSSEVSKKRASELKKKQLKERMEQQHTQDVATVEKEPNPAWRKVWSNFPHHAAQAAMGVVMLGVSLVHPCVLFSNGKIPIPIPNGASFRFVRHTFRKSYGK